MNSKLFFIIAIVLFSIPTIFAQTASFTFQGKLNDGATAANGTYHFQFKLYDANNQQVGQTLSDIPATVVNGIFTVNLDFGAAAFNGSPRSIEIGVRENCPLPCAVSYTLLNPRQAIASTPYAIKSLKASEAANALYLDGIPAAQFVQTNDARLSDSRTPTAGSGSYIQNTLFAQAANFNIGGNGTVGGFFKGGTINAVNQFQLNGERFIYAPSSQSIALGIDAGDNTIGAGNVFFGTNSGKANTTGASNTFLGADSGATFTVGSNNVAVGKTAGLNSSTGNNNTFVGTNSGFTPGVNGSNNTVIGYSAAVAANVSNATAIGKEAFANANNMIALGGSTSNVLIRGTLEISKTLTINTLGATGFTPLCLNSDEQIAVCSGSLANKIFDSGALKNQQTQIQTQAEQIKRQQAQIEKQNEQIKQQQAQIDVLKALICSQNPAAACQPQNK